MDAPINLKTVLASPVVTPAREICKIELLPDTVTNPHYLKRCFRALYQKKEVVVPPEVLKIILKTTLEIKYDELNETLQNVVVEMLQYLMLKWPHWFRSSFLMESSFLRLYRIFISYLQRNLVALILNESKYLQIPIKKQETENAKAESPCGILIGVPSTLLRNVTFSLNQKDVCVNIVEPSPLPHLKLNELLNWPYISVRVEFLDIAFKRRNVHQFKQYLNTDYDIANVEEKRICYVKKTQNKSEVAVFSYDFLYLFLSELVKHVLSEKEKFQRFRILKGICEQFAQDVKEANLYGCTVATNTSVCFNIGGNRYLRNSTVAATTQASDEKVVFTQEIIPRVEYTLEKFTVQQDLTFQQDFVGLKRNSFACCSIAVSCEFCHFTVESFDDTEQLQHHMRHCHSKEISVVCCKCKVTFTIENLAGNRWRHQCNA